MKLGKPGVLKLKLGNDAGGIVENVVGDAVGAGVSTATWGSSATKLAGSIVIFAVATDVTPISFALSANIFTKEPSENDSVKFSIFLLAAAMVVSIYFHTVRFKFD